MTCAVEIKEFCRKVFPGEGRITSCLKQHKTGLSEKCSQAVTRRQVGSALAPSVLHGGRFSLRRLGREVLRKPSELHHFQQDQEWLKL